MLFHYLSLSLSTNRYRCNVKYNTKSLRFQKAYIYIENIYQKAYYKSKEGSEG